MIKPIADTGDKLGKAVAAYNQAIGSMESRFMAALRKLKESAVVSENPPILEPLEQNPRLQLDVAELDTTRILVSCLRTGNCASSNPLQGT